MRSKGRWQERLQEGLEYHSCANLRCHSPRGHLRHFTDLCGRTDKIGMHQQKNWGKCKCTVAPKFGTQTCPKSQHRYFL